jgi:phage gp29-like protein
LGHAQTGARATSSNQQEVWYAALHALARYIQAQLNVFIRRLVDVNYPDVERYPKFVFRNIEARNLLEYAQGIALMANAEMLVPDEPTRDWVRRSIDAPAEDKDEARLRAETSRQEFALDKGDKAGVFQIEDDPSQTARPRNSKRNP